MTDLVIFFGGIFCAVLVYIIKLERRLSKICTDLDWMKRLLYEACHIEPKPKDPNNGTDLQRH